MKKLKVKKDVYGTTVVGYNLVDSNGKVRFYIETGDGRRADSKWNLHEGDCPISGNILDAFATKKEAVEAAENNC